MATLTGLLGVADQILSAFIGQMPPITYTILMTLIVVVRVLEQNDTKPT